MPDDLRDLYETDIPPLAIKIILAVVAISAIAGIILGFIPSTSHGAPAPFPRPVIYPTVPLTQSALVGDWVMCWGDTRYPITLKSNGRYECQFGSVKYVGSWGLDWEGRFWITESSRPQERGSWKSYAVRMRPGTLTGKIEVGAPGVAFRLERVRTVKQMKVEKLRTIPSVVP